MTDSNLITPVTLTHNAISMIILYFLLVSTYLDICGQTWTFQNWSGSGTMYCKSY